MVSDLLQLSSEIRFGETYFPLFGFNQTVLALHPDALVDPLPAQICVGALENGRLESVRRLKFEVEER